MSPTAIEALADIVRRSSNLCRLQAERLKTDDGYQVIDPRTVAATFQEFVQTATVDPAPIIKEQFKLWADLTLLWQKTATRFLFDTPVEPVIEPAKQDKRFKNEAWSENPLFDYLKQHYLLMSRYFELSVRSIKGVDPHTHHKTQFYARQFINALSPTNFVATNPTVLQATTETRGENLIEGSRNLLKTLSAVVAPVKPEDGRFMQPSVRRKSGNFTGQGRFPK